MAAMDIKHSRGGGMVFTPKTDNRTDLDSVCFDSRGQVKLPKQNKNAVYHTSALIQSITSLYCIKTVLA